LTAHGEIGPTSVASAKAEVGGAGFDPLSQHNANRD
jgi:hypothetical protein